jgi:predicted cupin superfamily sugar epimerase
MRPESAGPDFGAQPGLERGASEPGNGRLEGLTARQVAEELGLEPHREGGFFRETYRSLVGVATDDGQRPASTAILYLLTAESPSRFHRLASDELWFYHGGDCAELWLLALGDREEADGPPEQPAERLVVAPDRPCTLVPARRWMGARVMLDDSAGGSGAGWTLVSCVVTPGFEYDDFELADRESLLRGHPDCRDLILTLT